MYFDDCPVSGLISIYMTVDGIVWSCISLICIAQIVYAACSDRAGTIGSSVCWWIGVCEGGVGIFIIVWFIVGECISLSLSLSLCVCVCVCVCHRVCACKYNVSKKNFIFAITLSNKELFKQF